MLKKCILVFLAVSYLIFPQTASELFDRGMNAYNSGDYVLANRIFDEFFSGYELQDELYSTARFYSADALLNLGNKQASAAGFESLVNTFYYSNFRDRSLYKLGMIYYEAKDYGRSRSNFQKLLNEYPESEHTGSALYWIGESYSVEGRYNDAINFLKSAVESRRNNKFADYTIFTLANVYEKTGDYENAVIYYDRLLSYHKSSPLAANAQIRIGICYFKLKDYQSSILELNSPLLSDLPENFYSESLYLLANSYYRANEYSNAEKTYLEIIRNYPNVYLIREVKYGLGWTYFQQEKYSEAYNIFNSLSEGNDSIAVKSFYWKGEAKRYSGQESEAFKIFKDFLKKYPDDKLTSGVRYQIGVLYYNTKNYSEAEKFLGESMSSADKEIGARAFNLSGEIKLNKKQFKEARQDFETALSIREIDKETRSRSLLGLGAALFYLKEHKQGIEYLKEVDHDSPGFESDKVNFYLAENYYAAGDYSNALKRYELIDLKNPDLHNQTIYGKGYALFSLRQYENASYQFAEFIKRYPRDTKITDARLRLADSYYGSKNFNAASKIYRELFQFDRESLSNPYAYYQYAQALYKGGAIQEALNEFSSLQQKFPNSEYADESLYLVGWIHFQQGNFTESIQSYRNLLSKYPNTTLTPVIMYSIGDAYFNIGSYDSAIVNYQRVMDYYPNSPNVFDAVNGIQYSYIAKNQPERAVQIIDEFVGRNPGLTFSDQIYFKKGEIYYSLRDYDRARSGYKEFIASYPKSRLVPDAYYWIGKSSQNLNQNEEALFNYNRVFDSYPENEAAIAAVIEMGNIYNNVKNYPAAISVYDKALSRLKQSPKAAELMYNKGMTLINKGDYSAAYETLGDIINFYDGTLFADKAKYEIGLIELAARRYENADVYFSRLADSRTDDLGARARYQFGVSLFEQKRYDEAVTQFIKVRNIHGAYDEWVTRSSLKLGDTYVILDDNEKAKEIYRAVLTKHKGNAYGQEAQTKLRNLK
jgi:TolA-binding protein